MLKKTCIFIGIVILGILVIPNNIKAVGGDSPIITLLGPSEIIIEKGTSYYEYGATATDTEDGDLTSSIIIDSSSIDINTTGIYTVSYSVTDIDSNTTNISRTIKVGYGLSDESINDYQNYSSSPYNSSNIYSKVETLSNGDFAAVGTVLHSYYSEYQAFLYSKFNQENERILTDVRSYWGRYERYYDLDIDEYDQVKIAGYSGYYTYGIIANYNINDIYSNYAFSSYYSTFKLVDKVSPNQHIYYDSYSYYLYAFTNNTYQSRTSVGYNVKDLTSDGDGSVYIVYVNGTLSTIKKYIVNETTGAISNVWTKNIEGTSLSNLYLYDNSLYAIGQGTNTINSEIPYSINGSRDIYIIELDINGNIINSTNLGGSLSETYQFSNINDGKIIAAYISSSDDGSLSNTSSGLFLFNLNTFEVEGVSDYSTSFNSKTSLAFNQYGKVAIAGSYGSGSLGVARLMQFTPIFQNGLEDQSIQYASSFDPELGISFTDAVGNNHPHIINSIEGSVNTTIVGNHNLIYNISVLTDSGYKNLRLSRIITVEPASSILDGDIFNGSVSLDISGGTITVNGDAYNQNDIYNIPGESTITITGINGYSKSIDFTVNLMHSGIIENYAYAEPVALTFSGGTATLNGDPYISGTSISDKGDHTIVITGANGFTKTINFRMEPIVLNVVDGGIYYETITPNINAEQMTLNGDPYTNEAIANAGDYTLIINGVGGYIQTINFTVETTITGVEDGESYIGSTQIDFTKGTATINGNPLNSGETVNNPGNNILTITGEGGYVRSVNFIIDLVSTGISNGSTYQPSLEPSFSGGSITLNGTPYISGTAIDNPGLYTLIITGETGFSQTYYFTVLSEQINVVQGLIYYEPIVVAISNGTLLLNGSSYTSGTTLNASGSYLFEVIGEGGYYRSIEFSLEPGSNLDDNAEYVIEKTIQFVGTATLNGVPITTGYVVNAVGNYTFELTDGMFNETINFSIIPDYSIYEAPIYLSHQINISNATLELNGVGIINNHIISLVGSYELSVSGINGYIEIINFDVLPETNVIDQNEYTETFNLELSGGIATLNGTPYSGNSTINVIGRYELEISGENGFMTSYEFYVLPTITGLTENEIYIDEVIPTINHNALLLDGISYTSDVPINAEGFHTITIEGINGLSKEIEFLIVTSNLGIEEDGVYIESTSIVSNVFDFELNGNPYTSGTEITTLGKNTLKLTIGSSEKTIYFYVLPLIIGIEEGGIYSGSVTPNINHNNLLLNSSIFMNGTTINTVGHHVLKIVNIGSGPTLYTHEIHFTVVEDVTNVDNNGTYTGSVTPLIPFTASLSLNGNPYNSGTIIQLVGHHIIDIYGTNGYTSSITFTILPTITNVTDGGEYTSSVNPVIPNASLLLDGNNYISGALVNTVGVHTIIITGTNGYTQSISFTILPNIQNVIDGGVYSSASAIIPVINYTQSMTLNGESFTSGTSVRNVGYYELIIYGTGGYTKTINFTFNYVLNGVTDEGIYNGSVQPNIGYATLMLNDVIYTNNTIIYTVGYHVLKILGVGGYEEQIAFTIHPIVTGIINGTTYTSSRTITINYTQSIEINEIIFVSGSTVTQLGNYEVVVFGINEYTRTYQFTIDYSSISVTEGAVYTGAKQITMSNAVSLELNGDVFESGTTITTYGYYQLIINGNGNYQKTINFTMDYVSFNVTNGSIYTTARTITLPYAESIELNGEVIPSGTVINTYGNYSLVIYGVGGYETTLDFIKTYEPITVTDGSTYTTARTITLPYAVSIELNGEVIPSGTVINTYGNYTLVIVGEGNYQETINFVKTYGVINISNGSTYTTARTLSFPYATSMELNGNVISNDYVVNTIGNYDLSVYGENGYIQIFSFTIDPASPGVTDGETYTNIITLSVSNAIELYLNDIPIDSGQIVEFLGYYEFKILGEGNYEKTIRFTKVTSITGIADQSTYTNIVTPIIPNANLILNGEPFISGTPIGIVGNHILVLNGNGGYQQIVNFTINPQIAGVNENQSYVGSVEIDVTIDYTNVTQTYDISIDNEPYVLQDTFDIVGNHILSIKGPNDFEYQLNFTITEDVTGIVDQATYEGEVSFDIPNATILVNGEEFISGESIRTVGNHIITVIGNDGYESTIEITVTEIISGFIDEGEYTLSVTPIIPNATLILNGNPYISGTQIFEVGNHILTVLGPNGYSTEYEFTVIERLFGLTDGLSSQTPVSFNWDNIDEVTVNGNSTTSPASYNKVGSYIVVVEGNNNYVNEYRFTIELDLTNVDYNGEYQGFVNPVINSSELLLDGNPYINGSTIQTFGYHTLTVIGEGGYIETIPFVIYPDIKNVDDGMVYSNMITPLIPNAFNLLLNGEPFHSGDQIQLAGHYVLEIYGTNGYLDILNFEMIDDLNISYQNYSMETDVYYGWINVSVDNAVFEINQSGIFTDHVEIDQVGKYEISVIGINNYRRTFSVTLELEITNKSSDDIYMGNWIPKFNGQGEIYLNDIPYVTDSDVKTVGNNVLRIEGQNYTYTYEFVIQPEILLTYINEGVVVEISEYSSLRRDNEIAVLSLGQYKDTTIGHHNWRVYGINGYFEDFSYTVEPYMNIELTDYEFSIEMLNQPQIMIINDSLYNASNHITKAGNHVLTIYGTLGYSYVYSFTIKGYIEGIEDGLTYIEQAKYTESNADVYIDGIIRDSSYVINLIGTHSIVLKGINNYQSSPISITIQPSFEVDTLVDVTSLQYNFSKAQSVRLNGVLISKMGGIYTVGNHELTVFGLNGYEISYNFTIHPYVQHLTHDLSLNTPLNISYADQILVNDEDVASIYRLSDYGYYHVTIKGVNGYEKYIELTIPFDVSFNNPVYQESATFNFTNIDIFIDNIRYTNGTSVYFVGNHTLSLRGVGGYELNYNFTIKEKTLLQSGTRYQGSISLDLPVHATYMLNGEPISVGQLEINQIGNHTLVVYGKNEYVSVYQFYIDPVLTIADNEVLKSPRTLEYINATMILDGKTITEDTLINDHGSHTLIIKGLGEYEDVVINFRYESTYVKTGLIAGIPILSLSTFAFVWFLLRRKRVF